MPLSDVRKYSVTRDDLPDSPQTPIMQFIIPQQGENPDLPPYWSYARDYMLRASVRREGLWASAVHIATTKVAAMGTEFTGDAPRLRDASHQVLLNAEDGAGQVRFISRQVRDFITTDNGCFTEIVRSGGARGARIIGVMHLDSLRCQRTGDPGYPVIYRDVRGNEHFMRDYQVLTYSDMPDASETWHGVGLSAASRAWASILKMAAIERYYWEKISGNRAQSIDLVNGLSFSDLDNAVTMTDEQQKAKKHVVYKGAILIPTIQDTAPSHVRINFAELPDGFDYEMQFNTALLVYANSIGLDPQDLQPLTGRPMGSGDQSLILDEKAEQRGLVAYLKDFTHLWNENICPDRVTFGFTSSKIRRQKVEADIDQVRVDTAGTMVERGIINGSQGKQWLVDEDVLPKEFLDTPDQTQQQTISDEEKPEAEPEPQAPPIPEPPTPPIPAVKELRSLVKLKGIADNLFKVKAAEDIDLYELGLKEIVRRAYQGKLDAREAAQALRDLVRLMAPQVYYGELERSGISEADATNEDKALIKDFVARQYASSLDFGSEMAIAKSQEALGAVYNRMQLWVSAMQALAAQARMSVQANAMGTWRLGKTEEHCDTCRFLNGKRHRLRWFTDQGYIPREPGSETLECGGWNCDCKIVADSGAVLI